MFNRNLTPFSTMTIQDEKSLRLIENRGVKKRTMRNCLNFSSLPDRLVRCEPTLRVDKVRRKDGVYESRLSQSRLACTLQSHVDTEKRKADGYESDIGHKDRRKDEKTHRRR